MERFHCARANSGGSGSGASAAVATAVRHAAPTGKECGRSREIAFTITGFSAHEASPAQFGA